MVTLTFDHAMAARYSDHLLLLDRGRLVAEGAPLEVLVPERLERVHGIAACVDEANGWPLIVPVSQVGAHR